MLKWKTKELLKEYGSVTEQCKRRFKYMMLCLENNSFDAIVTSVYRSPERQYEIYKQAGKEYISSPHSFYRAIDIVPLRKDSNPLSVEDRAMLLSICALAEKQMPYGKGKIKSYLFHDIGLGLHLHIQSKD